MPSTFHLALRNATAQPSSLTPRHPAAHLYDRVNDAYGPGVYIAWVLAAISVHMQRLAPPEENPYRNMDKDLLVAVLYPVFVAGDLVRQVQQYPGPRGEYLEWWWRVDENAEFGPYGTEIWAAMQVCFFGLSWNTLFMFWLQKSRKRLFLLAIATLWITGALYYAAWGGDWDNNALVWMASLYYPVWLFCIVYGGSLAVYTLLALIAVIWQIWVRIVQRRFDNDLKLLLFLAFWIYITCIVGVLFGFILFAFWLLFPTSAHSVFETFQLMALGVGVLNLIFSMYGTIKVYGPSAGKRARQIWAEPVPEAFKIWGFLDRI